MNDIIQIDDFALDASDVRVTVTSRPFTTEKGPDGFFYSGIGQYAVPHWERRIGEGIGKLIIPRLSCFRLNLAGELPHSWIHSDGICAKYASVLYLNRPEQCQGGTAFWKHKQLGIDRMPDGQTEEFHRMMTLEWKKLEAWEQTHFVEMEWNRFITYPTSLFHSRYPFEGFGTSSHSGRLIWICFYDIEGETT